MISCFPEPFARKAVITYLAALAVSTVLFSKYSMNITFIILGIIEVLLFFFGSSSLTVKWARLPEKAFEKKLFWWAFALRLVWVVFSYFYFQAQTGKPFEYGTGDAFAYHDGAEWLAGCDWDFVIRYLFTDRNGVSDSGYVFYLTCFYRIFGVNIFLVRLVKCLLSSYLCVLMYRLASRHFGMETGRMTGIFCMLMPNLIWYCGLHLKEVEMIFLTVLSIERADYALRRTGKDKLWAFIVAGLSALMLFGFRTALGAVVFLSIGCTLLFSSSKSLAAWQKWVFGLLLAIGMAFTIGQRIQSEISEIWAVRNTKQETNMAWRATREGGNAFAVYAGKAVFAPLIFTIPFPTVVDIDYQKNQQMINGGNYVKNITSFFTIFSLIVFLISGNWRIHVLPMAALCGYLLVMAFSEFAQSERFHLPALPFALMFAAYGITHLDKLEIKIFKYWPYLIFVAIIGWSWFKLAGRGLV